MGQAGGRAHTWVGGAGGRAHTWVGGAAGGGAGRRVLGRSCAHCAHRFLLLPNGRRGLEGHADDNVLAIGQAPLHAPAAVGARAHLRGTGRECHAGYGAVCEGTPACSVLKCEAAAGAQQGLHGRPAACPGRMHHGLLQAPHIT